MMPDSTSAKVETIVANGETYELLSLLGVGAMGAVYRARQSSFDRMVAIKKLHSHLYADQTSLQRFRREAKSAAALNSANIVRVFSFAVTDSNEPLLIMEYIDGQTLSDVLSGQALPPAQFYPFFEQILEALSCAHDAGIVHRDLKPGNVMVTADGVIKLTDFGIAKAIETGTDAQRSTRTGAVVGTPLYMSPEQCRGEPADRRSDLYAVGCMMFQALTGRTPFFAENPLEVMFAHVHQTPDTLGDVASAALSALVAKALSKEPEQRFQSAQEMLQALRDSAMNGADRQRKTWFRHSRKRRSPMKLADARRGSSLKLLLVAALICILGCGTMAVILRTHGPSAEVSNHGDYRGDPLSKAYILLQQLSRLPSAETPEFRTLQRQILDLLQQVEQHAQQVHDNRVLGHVMEIRGHADSITDRPRAVEEWKKAVQLLSGSDYDSLRERIGTYYSLADSLRSLGKTKEAQQFAEQGVIDADHCADRSYYWQALVNEGKFFISTNQSDRARRCFEQVVSQTSEGNAAAEAQMELGFMAVTSHGYKPALPHFLAAAHICEREDVDRDEPGIYLPWLSQCINAHTQCGTCYAAQHDRKMAEAQFQQARQKLKEFLASFSDDGMEEVFEATYASCMSRCFGEQNIALSTICAGLERCAANPRPAVDRSYLESSKWLLDTVKNKPVDSQLAARFIADYQKLQRLNQASTTP